MNVKLIHAFVLSELLIALSIFGLGLALGAHFFTQQISSVGSQKNIDTNIDTTDRPTGDHSSTDDKLGPTVGVLDMKGIPSSAQMVKSLIDQGKKRKRSPKPWDASVNAILNNNITTQQKIQSLFFLGDSLPQEGRHYCYAQIALKADAPAYQKFVLPKIWSTQTPPDLTLLLCSGLISQPDSLKLPAAVELLQHPNEDVANLAYSLLWSYFPNELEENYPVAVRKFLSQPAR